jgi:hypothetical protein
MRKSLIAVSLLGSLLTGCAHNLTLHPRDGSPTGQGVAQEAGKTVTINLNGKVYSGTYVHDGGKVATFQSYGNATAYSGTKSASAFGSSVGTAYVPGSGNGRVLATSSDGDAIRCEFQYSNGSGIGVCHDNSGKEYDFLIHD